MTEFELVCNRLIATSQVIGEQDTTLKATLESLGIYLKPSQLQLDPKPLLRLVCEYFFGTSNGLVDMIVKKLPSPEDNALTKV